MKTKIFISLVLGIMFLAVPLCQAQNLLTDGDFSSMTEIPDNYGYPPPNVWSKYIGYYIDADATVVDGVCNFKINNSGAYDWEIQLVQAGFVLEAGHSYRLTFDVRADADRPFGVFLGENEGNWTSLIGYDRYIQYATTEWQTISLDFNVPCVFAYHKLSFELGTINTNMYFDNVVLEDIGLYTPTIGILGNALYGWDVDINLTTTDDIHYEISGLPLTGGRVKFRKDDFWCMNWGGSTFPTGTAYLYGPDIPVTNPGVYDITFNLETGEYSFTCVSMCTPYIGILGSAVPPYFDWETDVDLSTDDGITYTLKNYTFIDGEAKFRKDNGSDVSWGSADFPAGIATPDGANIPVKAGTYSVTFNIETGDFSFVIPSVGILGSALIGWDEDIDLQTTDGIIYTLSDYSFTDGEVKFRLENSWDVNWGDYNFPKGWGYQNGPNIPVPAGNYDVTFNKSTGEYNFSATTCPVPAIQCPYDVYLSSEPGMCGAYVFYPEVSAAFNCGGEGITIEQTEGLPSGSFFPVGSTANTFVLTNKEGNTATCTFFVYVFEFEPPVIVGLSDFFEPLWPANHKMVNVPIKYTTYDNCGKPHCELYVYSNEPENETGDGDKSPDWEIVDEHNVLLRAERSAKGTGREYYIYIVCYDDSWNYAVQQIVVSVPHDKADLKSVNASNDNQAKAGVSIGNVPSEANVWPNPSTTNFNLEVKSSLNENVVLSIFDNSGHLISTLNTNKHTSQFGDDLKPGIYLVIVRQGSNFNTIKIVKQ